MCRLAKIFVLSVLAGLFYQGASAQFAAGYGELYDSETILALKEHVNTLSAAQMEGRKAGSEGEKMAAEYVYRKLKSYGLDMLCGPSGDEFGMLSASGDTLVSRNVMAYIQGYDKTKTGHFIVVGARLDNLGLRMMTVDGQNTESIYTGANGNASGLAMMLELARMLSTNSLMLRTSVVFVAFGASCESFGGSWYFADRVFKDKIDVMVNLDMLGLASNGFYAYTASNVDLNAFTQMLQGTLQPIFPTITAAEPYPSDHRTFYAKEIPSVFFTTGRYSEHNTAKDTPSIIEFDGMEKELEYIFNFISTLSSSGRDIAFRLGDSGKKVQTQDDVVSYHDCDLPPAFLNSTNPVQFLQKWVYPYLKYPQSAIRDGIQGVVQVNFIVDKSGAVRDVKVIKSVDPDLDDEAVRVVSASPKWKPARLHGEKVNCSMTIGVEFRLQSKSERRKWGFNGYTRK